MIVSFYDENFIGLQNNASLNVEGKSYKLVKKPVELNELTCKCEAFTENIQPTFLIVKDNKGQYIYGSLAGIPELNDKNQTEINATDLKNILSSDILIEPTTYTTVNEYLTYLFNIYQQQVYQPFTIELVFKDNVGDVSIAELYPSSEKRVVDCLEEMQSYLKFYGLFIDSEIDLINKKVKFIIGKTMIRNINIKLWDYGIKNYGKWVASINECVGYYIDENNAWTPTATWILTKDNSVTIDSSLRDIFPIRRKIVTSNESLLQATVESLTELTDSLYNENIEIQATDLKRILEDYSLNKHPFETNFSVYVSQGEEKYKDLPCGKLEYDDSGLVKFQIGYRYTDINFI